MSVNRLSVLLLKLLENSRTLLLSCLSIPVSVECCLLIGILCRLMLPRHGTLNRQNITVLSPLDLKVPRNNRKSGMLSLLVVIILLLSYVDLSFRSVSVRVRSGNPVA